MSITAAIWFVLFLVLTGLTFKKSVWGLGLYLLTFYASPLTWWWGDGFLQSIGNRWNLVASIIFLLGTFLDTRPVQKGRSYSWFYVGLIAYLANAVLVHFLGASNPAHSYEFLDAIAKNVLLVAILITSVKDWSDLRLVFLMMVLGSSYLGYEVVFNEEGHYDDGRLEGVSISGVNGANAIASLLSFSVPLGISLVFFGKTKDRLMLLLPMVLTIEVIARCVSRGNMVGWIFSAVIFLIIAKGTTRRKAILGMLGCCFIALLFMGEQHRETFVTRFTSIFAEEEERDVSAQSRVDFTSAGLKMILDYPLGSGGEAAFRSDRGFRYIATLGQIRYRSCHNGYIDIAASWGIQGLVIYLGLLLVIIAKVALASRRIHDQNLEASFVGACLCAMLALQLVTCYFGSFLKGEWFYWWMAFGVIYLRLCNSQMIMPPQQNFNEAVRH